MKKTLLILSATILFSYISFAQDEQGPKLKPIRVDNKYGYGYDENTGILSIPARYDDALYFEDGLAPVKKGDKWGYIDATGTLKIPMNFDYANIFTDGYATVGKTGGKDYLYGIINKAGVLIVPMKYEGVGDVSEGLISVVLNGKMGFINKAGVTVIPLKFDIGASGQLSDFSGGYAKIQIGKKFEFINKTGKEITPLKYSAAVDFKEGMAAVATDTNWNKYANDGSKETKAYGFINTNGKEVIPCKYENVGEFDNGVTKAYLDRYLFHIDKTGKIVDTISKPAPKRIVLYDSTTFSGKINRTGIVAIGSEESTFIKRVTVNDMEIDNISQNPIEADLKLLKLKPGNKVTIKIIYIKGGKVWLESGQGLN